MSAESKERLDQLLTFVRIDPDNVSLRAEIADELILSGAATLALDHLDHALAREPRHPQLRFRRAVALRRAGRVEEAREKLEGLLAEGITDPSVCYERADLALQLGDSEGALQWVRKVTEGESTARHSVMLICCTYAPCTISVASTKRLLPANGRWS